MTAPQLPPKIAIDGPAASGKSTLALHLAQEIGYLFFDTGVMYRALTWGVLQRGVSVEDESTVTRLAEEMQIDVRPPSVNDGRSSDVWLDGKDISWEVRQSNVEANVSLISSYSGVRRALTEQQRRIGLRGQVVMVGRDIGTVVLPEADLKIYLDASTEERARRRCDELERLGKPADYDEVLGAMRKRDLKDSTRQVAPLRPASDARILNSDGLDADEVLALVRGWLAIGQGQG